MSDPVPPATCDVVAAKCTCSKPPGHVEQGDPVHTCPKPDCGGEWKGSLDSEDFEPIALPGFGGMVPVAVVIKLLSGLFDE